MPAGTWFLGRLRRVVDYVGLRDLQTVVIRDENPFSDNYFNIVEFPTVLTAGKNLFKIKANANTLVRNSRVHIEVLDYNNNPVYYEVVKYAEVDGTRVITIWVYPDTPPGAARVFVGGRARVNPVTNETFPFSYDINDPNYYNLPNVLCDMVYFSLIAKLSTKLVRYTLYLLSSNLLILDFAFSLYLSRKSIDF